ncbi:C40 family peptidase [Actinacidiphila acididurans]|uniref:C40 family peptidase n=1 Tax=Actinacidiphila acididurans TaxID=2784346 RepID=UPI0027DB7555|nr:bifunctional lytic transglycosylase/C40 family peptidase [Actinacidiphila acididurans]
MQFKRGLIIGSTAFVMSPVALGLAVIMLVATTGSNSGSELTADSLRIGGGGMPAEYADLIRQAADSCDIGLPAAVLAAQLKRESNFNPEADSGQAQGIAQFTPAAWESSGIDGNGDGRIDVWEPEDAIPSQGNKMCALLKLGQKHPDYNGSAIELALAGYNAGWGRVDHFRGVPPKSFAKGQTYYYVQSIMALVPQFEGPLDTAGSDIVADAPASVQTAIAWALAQRGGWYSFGGDCTNALGSAPAHRCDCSSLIQRAYAAGGITIPRATYDQVNIGHVVDIDHPQPGDLVFNPGSDGSDASPGHVAMYIGGGKLIEAPHTGAQIRVVTYSSWRDSTSDETRIAKVVRVVQS